MTEPNGVVEYVQYLLLRFSAVGGEKGQGRRGLDRINTFFFHFLGSSQHVKDASLPPSFMGF